MKTKSLQYRRFIPEGSFIDKYMVYMNGLETSREYDLWTAMYIIGAAIGRRVVVDRPRIPVFLNWYIILVAESGVTRKSTSVSVANAILQNIKDSSNIIQAKATPEMIDDRLHKLTQDFGNAELHLIISELVTVLGRERYVMAMPGLLTDLYDCPEQREGGTVSARRSSREVFVSFLSASTPSWLIRSVNSDVVQGGFTSRCMFIHSEHPKHKIAWPQRSDVTIQQLSVELKHLVNSSLSHPKITPTIAALRKFQRWYQNRELHFEPYQASFESREDSHILRAAACLAINDETWEIQPEHLAVAMEMMRVAKHNGALLFSNKQPIDEITEAADRLRKFLIERGTAGASRKEIGRKLRGFTSRELNAVLTVFRELKMVDEFQYKSGAHRPTTMWRGTSLLASDDALKRAFLHQSQQQE